MKDLIEKLRAGDRRALARCITRVEDREPELRPLLSEIYDERSRIRSIGVTGPPGAGKSTLTDKLLEVIRGRGESCAVVAIDPSSPFTGGALLGDRIRMNRHATDPGVFIRSFGTRGSLGGLSHATREAILLFAVAGFDWVVIETVGVGQSELDIMDVADTTLVVLVPEAGDTVQAMKAGLTEIADIFVVNKSDREGATRMKRDLELMVHLKDDPHWTIPVISTEAHKGVGIPELFGEVEKHREVLRTHPGRAARLIEARKGEFFEVIVEEVRDRLSVEFAEGRLKDIQEKLIKGSTNPYAAALELLAKPEFLKELLETPAQHKIYHRKR